MAREHDPFRPDFEMRPSTDKDCPDLSVHLINYPREAPYYQFENGHVDNAFRQFLVTGTTTPDRPEPWQQCSGQNNKKCATNCFTNRYSTGGK
eukprot:gene3362-4328_t